MLYTDSRIQAHKRESVDVQNQELSLKEPRDSLQMGSIAQKSELIGKKYPSGLSIERGSLDDGVS